MIEGTVSTGLTRVLVNAALQAGVSPDRLAHVPGLNQDDLADDLVRLPTVTADSLWQLLPTLAPGGSIAPRLVNVIPAEGAGLWGQMIGAGATLLDGLRDACSYLAILADPGTERLEVIENGGLTTLLHTSTSDLDPVVSAARYEFGLGTVLEHLNRAGDRTIVPVHVGLTHPAPRRHTQLTDMLGTRNVDFQAQSDTMTFLTADLTAPLPHVRPGLAEILRRHAELTLAAVRPALTWQDKVRVAIAGALQDEDCSLTAVARRLALSPRTLQRRLAEHGTTWRTEAEAVRRDQALTLLHDTGLTTGAIAGRVGYSDARALRRATHRWHGQSPRTLREEIQP